MTGTGSGGMPPEQRNAPLEIADDRYGKYLDGRGQSVATGRVGTRAWGQTPWQMRSWTG